jgi:hypothetical protein
MIEVEVDVGGLGFEGRGLLVCSMLLYLQLIYAHVKGVIGINLSIQTDSPIRETRVGRKFAS